uniref:(northern house mosquito) hypothetical protein n=1 Tax=Culex pipiens TaxID=7175 RepID=A0A8D8MR57_CULPI
MLWRGQGEPMHDHHVLRLSRAGLPGGDRNRRRRLLQARGAERRAREGLQRNAGQLLQQSASAGGLEPGPVGDEVLRRERAQGLGADLQERHRAQVVLPRAADRDEQVHPEARRPGGLLPEAVCVFGLQVADSGRDWSWIGGRSACGRPAGLLPVRILPTTVRDRLN